MNGVLARWNRMAEEEAALEILACCGSVAWARAMVSRRPLDDEPAMTKTSDEIWNQLAPDDWTEAFSKHPRIGQQKAPIGAAVQSASWSAQEQQNVAAAGEEVRSALAAANREYERRFKRVFIVCATGKSAPEILDILRRRLQNDEASEWHEAAEEQRKITNLRLKTWLSQ